MPEVNAKSLAETKALSLARLAGERQQFAPESSIPPLHQAQTQVRGRITEPPPEPEYLLEKLLIHKMVAAIIASGGKGKTFFLLQLSFAMASGKPFGPIRPTRPIKVLMLAAEDPQEILEQRLWAIAQGNFPDLLHVASVVGLMGPLMHLESSRPVRSEWFEWLRQTIAAHPGLDVLILDPKSRLYGLDENNNDHATQWVASLEALAQEFGIAIIFSHHVSKGRAESLNQAMSRGASALVDGCRLVLGLAEPSNETARRYGIANPRAFVELDVVKANYSPGFPSSVLFARQPNGVLVHAPMEAQRAESLAADLMAELSAEALAGRFYTRRALVYDPDAKHIAEALKTRAADRGMNFTKAHDLPLAIDQALAQGLLNERQDARGGRGVKARVLTIAGELPLEK